MRAQAKDEVMAAEDKAQQRADIQKAYYDTAQNSDNKVLMKLWQDKGLAPTN